MTICLPIYRQVSIDSYQMFPGDEDMSRSIPHVWSGIGTWLPGSMDSENPHYYWPFIMVW